MSVEKKKNKPGKFSAQLAQIQHDVMACRKCSRLVEWREKTAQEKVRRFAHETYWGKPIPGFGDDGAKMLIVGLAPAAHGGNRTGRVFTGDRSGDWLFETLHKFQFANQPHSISREDGMRLHDCYITAAVRCAPPKNKPLQEEKKNCLPYLVSEIPLLRNLCVIVALGKFAFDIVFDVYKTLGESDLQKRPRFGHLVELQLNSRVVLLASYHPSQQNTFTGKLTRQMFDSVFQRARYLMERER
ncbi:MAG: uracil-DNA glycosylase [bacterium]